MFDPAQPTLAEWAAWCRERQRQWLTTQIDQQSRIASGVDKQHQLPAFMRQAASEALDRIADLQHRLTRIDADMADANLEPIYTAHLANGTLLHAERIVAIAVS